MDNGPGPPSNFDREKWRAEHALEIRKWRVECKQRDAELALKAREQQHQDDELKIKQREVQLSRWTNPLVLAILGATLAGVFNIALNAVNNRFQIELESNKNRDTIDLERQKAEAQRILEMIKTGNSDKATDNLKFLTATGLISDETLVSKINKFIESRAPGTGPSLPIGAGTADFTGGCIDHNRLIGYRDNSGAVTNFVKVPC